MKAKIKGSMPGRLPEKRTARSPNVDLFLEMSPAYGVRRLRAFARDMRANWEEAVRQVEGRPDAQEQSVALTIHAAKGLEWPIVIPFESAL
jgi:superfamily I DNA/RNA helicase